jgi:hypothetical protein
LHYIEQDDNVLCKEKNWKIDRSAKHDFMFWLSISNNWMSLTFPLQIVGFFVMGFLLSLKLINRLWTSVPQQE